MIKLIALISVLFLVGCETTTTKDVVQAPVRTVEYINENGQRIIVNYYDRVEELNKGNQTDRVKLFQWEF